MAWQIAAILGGSGLLAIALLLASKNGSKSAQLEVLKQELKKQADDQRRANEIMDSVSNMDEHAVRNKLHQIANSQHK